MSHTPNNTVGASVLPTKTVGKSEKKRQRQHQQLASLNQHPVVIKLGYDYRTGKIRGGNARCIALLQALSVVIKVKLLGEKRITDFSRDTVLPALRPAINYLVACRKMSPSMGVAINHLKQAVDGIALEAAQSPVTVTVPEQVQQLIEALDTFIDQRIVHADESIVRHGITRIADGDVIVTFARSHVVELLFVNAHAAGKHFEVICLDAWPFFEGKELYQRLSEIGVRTLYVPLAGAASVFASSSVSKVFLGAAAMFANGGALARAGTATVALLAKHFQVPVLVFSEAYKFSDKAALNSLSVAANAEVPLEMLSHPLEPVQVDVINPGEGEPSTAQVHTATLLYDLTPMQLVDMVVCEVGLIPPSSVLVIIRELSSSWGALGD